jgi:hypothetical protein
VDPERPLSELGLDSLLAVELRNGLSTGLGLERTLPATLLFNYPSIRSLTGYLADDVLDLGDPVAVPTGAVDAELEAVAALSDEEAEALLLRELEESQ